MDGGSGQEVAHSRSGPGHAKLPPPPPAPQGWYERVCVHVCSVPVCLSVCAFRKINKRALCGHRMRDGQVLRERKRQTEKPLREIAGLGDARNFRRLIRIFLPRAKLAFRPGDLFAQDLFARQKTQSDREPDSAGSQSPSQRHRASEEFWPFAVLVPVGVVLVVV